MDWEGSAVRLLAPLIRCAKAAVVELVDTRGLGAMEWEQTLPAAPDLAGVALAALRDLFLEAGISAKAGAALASLARGPLARPLLRLPARAAAAEMTETTSSAANTAGAEVELGPVAQARAAGTLLGKTTLQSRQGKS